MKKLRVFVATPSDMAAERARVEVIAASLKPLADSLNIVLEVLDWSSVAPSMGNPEHVILEQIKPDSWDVFIGILWHRFGTPTGNKDAGTKHEYMSGTEEEFRTAYKLWQSHQRPRIMIYRCGRNIPPNALDPDQFRRVQDFFGQFDAQKGQHPGLYQTFDTTKSFENLLLNNLQKLLIEHKRNDGDDATETQPTKSAKVFICYKRAARDDRQLAEHLTNFLSKQGHHAFIDTSMRVGTEWLKTIDEQIRSSDYLVVLVSKDSADSEMVQAEVLRAYEYRNRYGKPKALPIRMNFNGLLPYTISAFLGNHQQTEWKSSQDNDRVAEEISNVVGGQLTQKLITSDEKSSSVFFSEDGRAMTSLAEANAQPLPSFDPRILEELEEPSGSLRLGDRFYIERESDEKLKRNIAKNGTTITIRASRQTGKSSLLVRGMHHVHASTNVVYIDLQSVEHRLLESAELFLKYLANSMVRKLKLDVGVVDQIWNDKLGPQDKLVKVMEEYILLESDRQIVLAIDEADRLLAVPFHSDFFALLRSWHNNRAVDPEWNKLNMAMVIATEPYLLISNPNQSPFNVGVKLNLEDFDREQVKELNRRHGEPIKENEQEAFFDLLNGHPYLTRKALYLLVSENWTWEKLYKRAADDQGPFADNLRRQLWFIQEDDVLQNVLRQVLTQNKSDNDKALWRLLRAGLIKGIGDRYYCRCGLYESYFSEHLR